MPALPIIAISIGDPNGVGVEIILKTFQDNSLFEQCIPVVYASVDFVPVSYTHLTLPTK